MFVAVDEGPAVPARLDALYDEAISSAATASSASLASVTVTHTVTPTAFSDSIAADVGHPKVNETTAGRSCSSSSSLSS